MDLTRLAADAGQFINRAVQVKIQPLRFSSLRHARIGAQSKIKLCFRFSTRARIWARRTGRSWSPGWRSCWPWQTPPRPARTRSSPRRRSSCSPTRVRAAPVCSYLTKCAVSFSSSQPEVFGTLFCAERCQLEYFVLCILCKSTYFF